MSTRQSTTNFKEVPVHLRSRRARTQFQKGSNPIKSAHREKTEGRLVSNSSGFSPYQRNPNVSPPQLVERPSLSLYRAAGTRDGVVPSRLRPATKPEQEEISLCQEAEENIIVNKRRLLDIANIFSEHLLHNPCNSPKQTVNIISRMGLCVSIQSQCVHCSWKSPPLELFTRAEKPAGGHGPAPGCLNESLALSVMKTKAGISDIEFFLQR